MFSATPRPVLSFFEDKTRGYANSETDRHMEACMTARSRILLRHECVLWSFDGKYVKADPADIVTSCPEGNDPFWNQVQVYLRHFHARHLRDCNVAQNRIPF